MRRIWTTFKEKWAEYLLEIVVIALSIFAGLELENWNEQRKEKSILNEYYDLLLIDFEKDLAEVHLVLDSYEKNIDDLKSYRLKSFESKNLTEVYHLMSDLDYSYKNVNFNSSTYQSLMSSGDLKLIPLEIQTKLLDLVRNHEKTYDMDKLNDLTWQGIQAQADQAGYALKYIDSLGLAHNKLQQRVLSGKDLDHLILKMEASIAWKEWNDNIKNRIYNEILDQTSELVELIQKERSR